MRRETTGADLLFEHIGTGLQILRESLSHVLANIVVIKDVEI